MLLLLSLSFHSAIVSAQKDAVASRGAQIDISQGPDAWAQVAGRASYHSICRGIVPTGTCSSTARPASLVAPQMDERLV